MDTTILRPEDRLGIDRIKMYILEVKQLSNDRRLEVAKERRKARRVVRMLTSLLCIDSCGDYNPKAVSIERVLMPTRGQGHDEMQEKIHIFGFWLFLLWPTWAH